MYYVKIVKSDDFTKYLTEKVRQTDDQKDSGILKVEKQTIRNAINSGFPSSRFNHRLLKEVSYDKTDAARR